jgi:hypothetical protein
MHRGWLTGLDRCRRDGLLRCVAERDQDLACPGARVRHRAQRHRAAALAVAIGDAHAGVLDPRLLLERALDRAGDDRAELTFQQVEDAGRHPAPPHLEQPLGAAEAVEQRAVLVDQEARRHELIEQLVVGREDQRIGAGGARQIDRHRAAQVGTPAERQPDLREQLDVAALAIDLPVIVEWRELVGQRAGALARAHEQHAAGRQSEMKQRQHGALRGRLQIDQHVPARDEAHLRERGVLQHVVTREHDQRPQLLRDLESARPPGEEALESRRADVRQLVVPVDAHARKLERQRMHVGREDLEVDRPTTCRHLLVKQHRERVRLLAGGAARDPQAHLLRRWHPVEDLRDDLALERLERFRIAKELGHADQEILVQRVELVGLGQQLLRVRGDAVHAKQIDAALDAAGDGAGLVEREVDAELIAQQAQHGVHRRVLAEGLGVLDCLERRQAAEDARDVAWQSRVIDDPGRLRAQRHAVELRARDALGEHHPAGALDVDDAARAVAAAAGQHDRHRLGALVLRQRAKELIDR